MNKEKNKKVFTIIKKQMRVIKKHANHHGYDTETLEGLCGYASGLIFEDVKLIYKNAQIVGAWNKHGNFHFFIHLNENIILDITSKQFDLKNNEIEILNLNKLENIPWYWKKRISYNSKESLIKYMKRTKWVAELIPPK